MRVNFPMMHNNPFKPGIKLNSNSPLNGLWLFTNIVTPTREELARPGFEIGLIYAKFESFWCILLRPIYHHKNESVSFSSKIGLTEWEILQHCFHPFDSKSQIYICEDERTRRENSVCRTCACQGVCFMLGRTINLSSLPETSAGKNRKIMLVW